MQGVAIAATLKGTTIEEILQQQFSKGKVKHTSASFVEGQDTWQGSVPLTEQLIKEIAEVLNNLDYAQNVKEEDIGQISVDPRQMFREIPCLNSNPENPEGGQPNPNK